MTTRPSAEVQDIADALHEMLRDGPQPCEEINKRLGRGKSVRLRHARRRLGVETFRDAETGKAMYVLPVDGPTAA
jgi:hypothetical protein